MRNRSSSSSGSLARRSIASSRASWRCSSDWLRRARFRKMSLMPWRSRAWPTAASTAVCWTAANACRTWPISSEVAGSSGASADTSTSWPAASRLHHVGQPLVGQFQRRLAQRGQLTDQATADPRCDTMMDRIDREQAQPARQEEFQVRAVGVGRRLGGELRSRPALPALESPAATPPTACLPRLRLDRGGLAGPGVAHQPCFPATVRAVVRLRADVVGVVGAVLGSGPAASGCRAPGARQPAG